MSVDLARIQNTLGKMQYHLATHDSICVGVSGGSDSNIIVHMIATYFRQYLPKVHFVFQHTGLEYKATMKHLDYMEERYDIHIERIRGKSVVWVVKHYGIPIISKDFCDIVKGVQHNQPCFIKRYNRTKDESNYYLSPKKKAMAKYLIDNKIPIDNACCKYSKKKPFADYCKQVGADLRLSGERQCEGGVRASKHKDCFEPSNGKSIDKYMPLFFWNDETKAWYKEHEKIVYSDCYEVWGMKRTGCVGCPFNSELYKDLDVIKEHEPQMYKACMNVFGESYRLMDMFDVRRHRIFKQYEQMSIDDYIEK